MGPLFFFLLPSTLAAAQDEEEAPVLRVGDLPADFVLDGRLDEAAWEEADTIENLVMLDPIEGEEPTERTTVKVLASPTEIVFGFRCSDSKPEEIVSRTMERDSDMDGEDQVRIVLGTYLDGRTGYVFTVNALGARRDALVARRGERDDRSWDGIWEAKTSKDANGWSVEIRIPIQTLSFRAGLRTWHFNAGRSLPRNQEHDRWTAARRDYEFTQTSRAGLLTDLPDFDLGLGLSVTPTIVARYGRPEVDRGARYDYDGSLDITQRIGPSLTASLTLHTDFSETEVDARQTNLTRFPLFFPEKRSFFLEGKDLYEYGIGLTGVRRVDMLPFHSRRIGLVSGNEVPLIIGGKVNGRHENTSIGALAVRMDEERGVAPETGLGVIRLKQDVLEESSVGMIATFGDPLDRDDAVLVGPDAVFQTSEFLGNKNLLIGGWALYMHREDTDGAGAGAYGAKIDYPNDTLDLSVTWKRIGREFDPPLGFVRRTQIHQYDGTTLYKYRPAIPWLRETRTSQFSTLWTDLDGHWESYRSHIAPLDFQLEEGDFIGVHFVWEGDKPDEDFEVAEGKSVRKGTYEWFHWHPYIKTAEDRWWSARVRVDFGEFYDGRLTSWDGSFSINPHPLFTISAGGELNIGDIEDGNFREELVSSRVRLNLSPDFNVSSFVQFDTESRNIGSFSRLRWTITPDSELFVVYTYNWLERGGHLDPQTYEGSFKVQYTLRF